MSLDSLGTGNKINSLQNLGVDDSGKGSLSFRLLINIVPVTGEFDTAATCSVMTQDLARLCEMDLIDDSIDYLSANNIRATSLGSAIGTLTFNVGSLANNVHMKHSLPIIPGTGIFLIGRDLLNELGLLTDDGLVIQLDKEHRTILNAES
ncbi:hypothetical protein GEMRC1_009926 [Eukaryota sp. GEM-RC1]